MLGFNEGDSLVDAAIWWYGAGYCVVPCNEDGKKRPYGPWTDYQNERLPWEELEALLNTGKYTGIGVITGASSGNIELLEIEGPIDEAIARINKIGETAKQFKNGIPELLYRVKKGCVETSPGGGVHFFIRVTDGPAHPNTKLAYVPDPEADSGRRVVAETRGQGGFVVVAPTPARIGHPEGAAYTLSTGCSPDRTAEVTSEERDVLHALFQVALDEAPEEPVKPERKPKTAVTLDSEDSPFDAYRRNVTWREILEPHGWTYSHNDHLHEYWTRPGKNVKDGASASSIEDGPLYVFSTNAGLPTHQGLSKADVYAHYNHAGDLSAAAKALSEEGYGQPQYAQLAEFIFEPDTQTDEDETYLRRLAYQRLVKEAALKIKVSKDAKALIDRINLGNIAPLEGIRLDEFLNQEDEEEQYRIQGLWPANGRVLLAAAAKSGKTTLVAGNLIPSLVDGDPFLGTFTPTPTTRRVIYLNMEVGERTLRNWIAKTGIDNRDRVTIVNLRGRAGTLQIGTPEGRDRFATFLREHDAEIVILDPLAPVLAALGLDENDNSQIAQFFSWWGESLSLAGVTDDLIVHHTGHAGDRSRGASRLLDEPDSLWTLKRMKAEADPDAEFQPLDKRFLHAYGRDVELPESGLEFDPETGRLTLTGLNAEQTKEAENQERYITPVVTYIRDNPGSTQIEISNGVPGRKAAITKTIRHLVDTGVVSVTKGGRNSWLHFIEEKPSRRPVPEIGNNWEQVGTTE